MHKRTADCSPPLPVPLARSLPLDEITPLRRSAGDDAAARCPSSQAPSVSRPVLIAGTSIELRDVEPDDVAERLRGMLGLAPEQPAPGEAAASYLRPLPPLVQSLDTGAWIAWCLAGLVIFGEGFPALATIRRESKRVGLALALVRAQGRISPTARMLGASRKVVRENLRALGLIPQGDTSTGDRAAACEAGQVHS